MRNIYPKFSLAWIFVLILQLSSFAVDSNKPSSKDKVADKPVRNDRNDRNDKNDKNDKARKLEGLPNPVPAIKLPKRKIAPVTETSPVVTKSEDIRSLPVALATLPTKGVKPIPTIFNKPIGPDPFAFTISSNKDSVGVGEEFELTVRVDWVDFGINNGVKFLPEWYKYALKVTMPKGFVQTGGDYTDYCTKPVDAQNPQATFTIKGRFEFKPEETVFKVLRGFEGAGDESTFVFKGEKSVNLKLNNSIALKRSEERRVGKEC